MLVTSFLLLELGFKGTFPALFSPTLFWIISLDFKLLPGFVCTCLSRCCKILENYFKILARRQVLTISKPSCILLSHKTPKADMNCVHTNFLYSHQINPFQAETLCFFLSLRKFFPSQFKNAHLFYKIKLTILGFLYTIFEP